MEIKYQPKTFIIVIPDHPHSQSMYEQCAESAKNYKWKLTKFNAINGNLLSDSYWISAGLRLPDNIKGENSKFLKRKGAQGCFMSHFFLWKKSVELNEPIVILEHDAIINNYWNKIECNYDVLKLFKKESFKNKEDKFTGNWQIGAHGYLISPIGAKKIIDWVNSNFAYHADMLLGTNIINLGMLETDLITLNVNNVSTTNIKHS